MTTFFAIISLCMVALGVLLLYDVAVLLYRRRFRSSTWLTLLLGVAVIGLFSFAFLAYPRAVGIAKVIATFLDLLGVYFVSTFIVFCVRTKMGVRYEPEAPFRYVVVLGGGLVGAHVGRLLATRLEKGIECLMWHSPDQDRGSGTGVGKDASLAAPGRCVIVSGGQGSDEVVSEASAMRDYLIARGVPRELVFMEDRSRNTSENLRFSREVIEGLEAMRVVTDPCDVGPTEGAGDAGAAEGTGGEDGSGSGTQGPSTVIVTNDFHAVRAQVLARRAGFGESQVVSCHTLWYYFPAAFIREFVGFQRLYAAHLYRWSCLAVLLAFVIARLAGAG